mmetsp:Transcript_54646/g.119131  ORF Transcript_54646/g.119131 Transcript_54646/m.119131 type:complete len:332 (-) Transcript_54646:768-1763(-)
MDGPLRGADEKKRWRRPSHSPTPPGVGARSQAHLVVYLQVVLKVGQLGAALDACRELLQPGDDVPLRHSRPDPGHPRALELEDAGARGLAQGLPKRADSALQQLRRGGLVLQDEEHGRRAEQHHPVTSAAQRPRLVARPQRPPAVALGLLILLEGGAGHAQVREREAELLVLEAEVLLLDREALEQELPHPLHVAAFAAGQRQVVQGDGRLHVAGPEVALLNLQAPLKQDQPPGDVAELAVDAGQIHEGRGGLHVPFAVVPLLDLQAPLQKHLLLLHVAQLAMGRREVVQGDSRVDVAHAEVVLLDRQAPLQELLLLLHVAQLAVRTGQLR